MANEVRLRADGVAGALSSAVGTGAASYSSTILGRGPLAYWRFGDAAGSSTAADSSGNGRTLTLTNGTATYGVAGLITGDADTAVDAADPRWSVGGTAITPTRITIETWIKTSATGLVHVVLKDNENSMPNRSFQFRLNAGKVEFIVFNTAGTVASAVSSGTVNNNVRRHIAGTFDGTTARVYVDGAQAGSAALSGDLSPASAQPMRVAVGLTATLDELAIYGSALSATDIATSWDVGRGVASGTATSTLQSAGFADLPAVDSTSHAALTLFTQDATTGRVTKREVVHVTAHTAGSTSVTAVRSREGTTGQAWAAGDRWVHSPTVRDFGEVISPNGTRYRLTVSDAGALTTVAVT